MNFHELGIESSILRSLKEIGYEEPTPIQREAIPAVLAGRDLLGCAQTGTGKTAAFSLPMLQRMGKPQPGEERPVRGLILTPTRELALQIYENICQYSRYTGRVAAVIYGGVSQVPQVEALARGADILVATPGRLWDLMGQKLLDISKVQCFVLDEADRMLDMGFINDVKRIVEHLPRRRQTLLFSATMPEEIAELANDLLFKPVRVSITPAATPVELIEQGVYFAEKAEKRELLKAILRERNVPQTLVFSRTKHGADRIARDLNRAGISARALHGDKSQGARQTALKEFKEYKIAVLVATDIAARGLDISELPLVINFDLPNVPETYVHRIGRTGRAGMEGTALSFCAEDEKPYLRDIEKLTRVKVPELDWPEGVLPEEDKPAEPEHPARTGRRKAAAPEKRKQKQKKEEPPVEEVKPAKKKKKAEPKAKPHHNAPTEALAAKYPKSAPKTGGRDSRRRRGGRDDLSMDISTPRVHELSEEAAARVRAKVMAKLAERAAVREQMAQQQAQKAAQPAEEKPARRRSARVGRRRGARKPQAK
ncbi:MAG: DEAD/DEAH box helicase [Butyricicoccus sp.]|nr:DEAD/DEAH box helicase [Butyricicoccus sp.]